MAEYDHPLEPTDPPTTAQRIAAYAVHAYTASGIVFVFLATAELFSEPPDPRRCFLWLLAAVAVDATDGPLARRCHVQTRAPKTSGRKIDDIVDYLSFTFVPLLLVWRMDWLPLATNASWIWVAPPLIASLFGFASTEAKHEEEGFFGGFPSYWNIVAFYAGLWFYRVGPWPLVILLLILALATVLPFRFIYPNLAPRPWRTPLLVGAAIWTLLLIAMLPSYPHPPAWMVWLSLLYPLFYTGLSFYLDVQVRRRR
ncbi:CDP-alcohol phosphatidyltransferase family protein [Candidatus Laterigemmans baculatus]|uniref:CDP-alcohol phosphatidyltransferase family protein n=1 Tax=Candidatus Laterigemmans baculatus TaxID=2770505 RepID=UPI0013DBBAFB|nr:CDP-alcohol phosphatidyltransferase family protein [Candidatus Laterigemmans baculatus]